MRLQPLDLRARVRAPEDEFTVLVRAGHEVVRTAPSDLRRWSGQGCYSDELLDKRAIEAPDRDGRWVGAEAVVAGREALEGSAAAGVSGRPLHAAHHARQLHAGQLPRLPGLPDDDEPVRTAGHEPPGVARHATRPDGPAVALVGAKTFALRYAPDANDLVLPAGEQQVPVTVPADGGNRPLVTVEHLLTGVGLCVLLLARGEHHLRPLGTAPADPGGSDTGGGGGPRGSGGGGGGRRRRREGTDGRHRRRVRGAGDERRRRRRRRRNPGGARSANSARLAGPGSQGRRLHQGGRAGGPAGPELPAGCCARLVRPQAGCAGQCRRPRLIAASLRAPGPVLSGARGGCSLGPASSMGTRGRRGPGAAQGRRERPRPRCGDTGRGG
mmetsp:Transcript_22412/g.76795  ORF Transcript_22412/g.76795 Transcript_22412/m.76795 type:complete len:384 (-) Transcript_22412:2445-3596(-)